MKRITVCLTKQDRETAVLVSEVTMEPRPWKWQGYIFSPAPLLPVYRLTWLSLSFSLKRPKPKETGQTRAGNFQREADLPGIFLVPRDGPSSYGLEMHCARVLEGCSRRCHSPPPRKEAQKKKKAERAGRTTEHTAWKVFLLYSGVRQGLYLRRLW